jgi:hypothetical protein
MSGLRALQVDCAVPDELRAACARAADEAERPGRRRKLPSAAGAALAACAGGSLARFLFVKAHGGRGGAEGAGEALFVANVPPSWGAAELGAALARFGELSECAFGESGLTRFARVSFRDARAQRKLLKQSAAAGDAPLSLGSLGAAAPSAGAKPTWLERYEADRPGHAALQAESSEFLAAFAAAEKAEEERRRELSKQVDADGFTTVTYGKGARVAAAAAIAADTLAPKRSGAQPAHIAIVTGSTRNLEMNKKHKVRSHHDFYTFQGREKKREQLAELRERFERDKRHIERLKAARKFNPL